MAFRTTCGPRADRPKIAPSYRPAGEIRSPFGVCMGVGSEYRQLVKVEVMPTVSSG